MQLKSSKSFKKATAVPITEINIAENDLLNINLKHSIDREKYFFEQKLSYINIQLGSCMREM